MKKLNVSVEISGQEANHMYVCCFTNLPDDITPKDICEKLGPLTIQSAITNLQSGVKPADLNTDQIIGISAASVAKSLGEDVDVFMMHSDATIHCALIPGFRRPPELEE